MTVANPVAAGESPAPPKRSHRIAAIDWMRGFVMLLMVVDHASMAFDAHHMPFDSAMFKDAPTMALPGGEFFTRWMTHLCAPTFVFLAGTSLALSIERRVARGMPSRQIDRDILIRGALIALIDPTIVSLGSGKLTFQVLFAIGVAMMCMAPLRRLPTSLLLALGLGWFGLGEIVTGWCWSPPGSSSKLAAFLVANYGDATMIIKYPVLPWLAIMILGWAFGRYLVQGAGDKARVAPQKILFVAGLASLAVFFVVRANQGYGDMFLHRGDNSWQEWLHVSKYPPSLTYAALELGISTVALSVMMILEPRIGVRENGVMLVFGQTSMFFYLAHRLTFEVSATYFGLRGAGGLAATYWAAGLMLVALYPACLWYRKVKTAHPDSFLKYF